MTSSSPYFRENVPDRLSTRAVTVPLARVKLASSSARVTGGPASALGAAWAASAMPARRADARIAAGRRCGIAILLSRCAGRRRKKGAQRTALQGFEALYHALSIELRARRGGVGV